MVKDSRSLENALSISVALSSLATASSFARTKILHDNQLSPFVCAVGFGYPYDCCVIAGDSSDNHIISSLLLRLAGALNRALVKNESLMGIDISKALSRKGVWIVPDVSECEVKSDLFNLISERLAPKRLMEVTGGNGAVRYNFGKKESGKTRLMAFLLAASSGYDIEKSGQLCENSLCNWFVAETMKPAYRISADTEENTVELLFQQLIEAFILFIVA